MPSDSFQVLANQLQNRVLAFLAPARQFHSQGQFRDRGLPRVGSQGQLWGRPLWKKGWPPALWSEEKLVGSQGTLGHGLPSGKGASSASGLAERNESFPESLQARHFPTCWAKPKVDPRGSALGSGSPWGGRRWECPSGELTPHEWKLPAPGVLRRRRPRAPAGPVPARAAEVAKVHAAASELAACCNVWWRLQRPVRVCSWGTSGRRGGRVWLAGRAARRLLAPYISFTAPGSAAGQRRG